MNGSACKFVNNENTNAFPQVSINRYGGIPQNLIINSLVSFVLILLFITLRKSAWKVISHKLLTVEASNFSSFFSSGLSSNVSSAFKDEENGFSESSLGFWSWFASIFTLQDDSIYQVVGNDGLQYLRFQRHVIFYLFLVTVLCLTVILPLNFQGNLQGDALSFEHTTLVNLDPLSSLLWTHIVISFLFFPLSILVMRRFSVALNFTVSSLEVNETLMIFGMEASLRREEALRSYFEKAYPHFPISKIHFAYNINKLSQILKACNESRLAVSSIESSSFDSLTLIPVPCSRYFSCFCLPCVPRVSALDYYSKEFEKNKKAFNEERRKTLENPLPLAFLSFKNVKDAQVVYEDFKKKYWICNSRSFTSMTFAPSPSDIYWENLSCSQSLFWIKWLLINILLFIITFFFTTPEVLVTQTSWILNFFGQSMSFPSNIIEFFPTLLLWSFTSLLPLIVSYTDRVFGHRTRSQENHAIMKKTFMYLLFMVIIIPSLGLSTLEATLDFLVNSNSSDNYRWECIFLPDSGAFFINYVTTAALTGAGLELLRVPDLVWYSFNYLTSKSKAEDSSLRLNDKYEFRFGEQYARLLLLYSMTIIFSVSCPLITPFGLLYFIIKHYVDRHNIIYVYKPSKINQRVHATAIGFVVLAPVLLQFLMLIFNLVRNAENLFDLSTRSKITVALFITTIVIYFSQVWSETCKKLSPIKYLPLTIFRDDFIHPDSSVFLPDILKIEDFNVKVKNYESFSESRNS